MGRILTQMRTTQNVTMNQHYAYNLAGGVVQLWLPEVGNTTQNFTYDNAGNVTAEPGRSYQYDAESRIKSVKNGSVATYQYDGNGRRAVKNSASGTRTYFFDVAGGPVAESGPTGVWLSGHAYFQNRRVVENTGSRLLWRHPDHLGTAVVRSAVALVGSVR